MVCEVAQRRVWAVLPVNSVYATCRLPLLDLSRLWLALRREVLTSTCGWVWFLPFLYSVPAPSRYEVLVPSINRRAAMSSEGGAQLAAAASTVDVYLVRGWRVLLYGALASHVCTLGEETIFTCVRFIFLCSSIEWLPGERLLGACLHMDEVVHAADGKVFCCCRCC